MMKFLVSVLLTAVAVTAQATPLPNQPHIYVEGSATAKVEPDEMEFSVLLEHTADTLAKAKAVVDERSFTLIELCKQLGIKPADIATSALRITPSYSYENNRPVPTGTTVARGVDIHLRDLSNYAGVMKALVDAQVSQTLSTKLVVSNEQSLADDVLVKAVADAKSRAERIARAQGKALGEAFSISEFMTRGGERHQLQVSRSALNKSANAEYDATAGEPFEPGLMVTEAQVYVVYLLKDPIEAPPASE